MVSRQKRCHQARCSEGAIILTQLQPECEYRRTYCKRNDWSILLEKQAMGTKACFAKNKKRLVLFALVFICIMLAACAPRQAPSYSEDEDQAGEGVVIELPPWSPTANCETCHLVEVESGTNSQCTYSLHTDTDCLSCHSDADNKLADAHEGYAEGYAEGKQPVKLKGTSVDTTICQDCHDDSELRVATSEYTGLVDTNMTVVNPHDLPQTEQHLTNISCSSCHKMHKDTPLATTSSQSCLSCHHSGVFECYTCHGEKL
jgi:hypothetical protein